jgi:hypothetical protein
MIVRMLAAAHLAVDPGRYEAAGDRWARQQAIDGQSGGVAERVPDLLLESRMSFKRGLTHFCENPNVGPDEEILG